MKKFETISKYYIRFFGKRVFRFPVGGFSNCPNRDPYTKEGGCLYCDIKGSGSDFLDYKLSIKEQIEGRLKEDKNYILYFQPYTSTYKDEEILIKNIEEGLKYRQFLGVSIGTRADCISDRMWEYLGRLNKKTYLELEIGLQSAKEETLKFIKRGHTLKDFEEAVKKGEKLNINLIVHIILGLP
ncbi:MAG: radical SAM protein, partial [Thermoanaerobaculia bacterium]